ncbi:hypothetical protein [Paenibacillus kobensis]|uniref:hypothetical protein n=1 Tax=Paenibacillus kobensis TaxID=59841 RepID=UPI001FE32ED4|nr:hypothetical protein [Paenibacillus kobensis]
MKKRFVQMTGIAAAVIIAAGIGLQFQDGKVSGADDSASPGSVNDPVVTKSYVDQAVANAGNGLSMEQVQQMLDQLKQELAAANTNEVVVVSVPAGKTLIAKDGAEFVVRAGKAVVYSADVNGISDLTDGKDITNGKTVPNNHLILFPRGGRGVMPDPAQKNGLTVLVRGQYELK